MLWRFRLTRLAAANRAHHGLDSNRADFAEAMMKGTVRFRSVLETGG